MAIEERKLTPAGQGNLQQIKLGIPVVEALNRMAEDPMGENEKLLLRILEQNKDKKVVLLELGVGFNTPIIIRFPFEKMVRENSSYSLIRLNMDEAVVPESFGERAIGIGGDMAKAITDIRGLVL